jgi:hypothetical protein
MAYDLKLNLHAITQDNNLMGSKCFLKHDNLASKLAQYKCKVR